MSRTKRLGNAHRDDGGGGRIFRQYLLLASATAVIPQRYLSEERECVCVCARERGRERQRQSERERVGEWVSDKRKTVGRPPLSRWSATGRACCPSVCPSVVVRRQLYLPAIVDPARTVFKTVFFYSSRKFVEQSRTAARTMRIPSYDRRQPTATP